MIGEIIGGVAKLGASIAGGIANRKAADAIQANLAAQQKKNQDWYDRRYNEDATQRADAQRLLTFTEQSIKERNKQAAGAAAVMGGTEESVAAAKAANNQALADTMGQINAQADARKDDIENQYMRRDATLVDQQNQIIQKKAENTAEAVKGVSEAASSLATSFIPGS